MKNIIFVTAFLFGIFCFKAYAHPPSEIEIEYKNIEKILVIKIKHVTQRNRDHYIRRVVVIRNGEEIEKVSFNNQKPKGLEVEIEVDVKTQDEVTVKAICSKAGSKEASIMIPEQRGKYHRRRDRYR